VPDIKEKFAASAHKSKFKVETISLRSNNEGLAGASASSKKSTRRVDRKQQLLISQ
jgi:hypothetical protein